MNNLKNLKVHNEMHRDLVLLEQIIKNNFRSTIVKVLYLLLSFKAVRQFACQHFLKVDRKWEREAFILKSQNLGLAIK